MEGRKALIARVAIVGVICALGVCVPSSADCQTAAVTFEIPAQDLGTALRAFARASRSQVAFDAASVRGRKSGRLNGTFPPEIALKRLLSGTGLGFTRSGAGMFIIMPLARAAQSPSAARVAEAAGEAEQFSEIVVTARKREERAVDVPVALSAVRGRQLERRGARSTADFLQEVPGVGIYDRGTGLLKVTIRGVSTSLGANENGYYLDDMPFTGVTVPISPDVRAWDLDRVEVLRGPQGTLFGEGSLGGTVRILTKGADVENWEGKGDAYISRTDGGGINRGIKGAFNVPVVPGILGVRVAGTAEHLPGWVDNDAAGQHNLNDQSFTTYRVKARLDPMERLTINGSYWFYKGRFPGGDSTATDAGQQSRSTVLASSVKYGLTGVSALYDFGGAEAFYGYSHSRFDLPQSGPAVGGQLDTSTRISVDTHEARFASAKVQPLQWTIGVYLRNARRHDSLQFPLFDIDNAGVVTSKARAVFGEMTYTLPFAPVDLTAGLRYYHEALRGSESNAGVVTEQPGGKYQSWNPRFSLAWHPRRNATIYASAAKGFRAGQLQPTVALALARPLGINLPGALAQDSIWSYEIGGKAELFDRLLTLEAAVYYSEWKNVAVRIPIGDTGYNGLINSNGTRTKGVELSVASQPISGLTLIGSGSYTDASYASSVPGTGIRAGTAVDDVAKFTASASAEYRKAVTDTMTGVARISWQHGSPRHFASFAGYLPGDRIDRLDLRFGIETGRYTISLFADNLTNEQGAESFRTVQKIAPNELDVVANRPRPRTLGIELSFFVPNGQ